MTLGESEFMAADPVSGLEQAYERGENDEFVKPTLIQSAGELAATINDGDAVLFMNFRADRAREMTRTFVDEGFDGFERKKHPNLADFVMLTEYAADIKTSCAYPPEQLINGLGEYLAGLGKTQLRIAETEKYAHVTFFFNGGQETPFPGEERILVPSPKVPTYDLQPEMSAPEVTRRVVEEIGQGKFDFIVLNYANCDMVGHTGVFEAAVKAVEAVDAGLGQVLEAIKEMGGTAIVTADHGNAEQMVDPETGEAHTAHTSNLVPVWLFNAPEGWGLKSGILADLAPSILDLMGIAQPPEMTGQSLIVRRNEQ